MGFLSKTFKTVTDRTKMAIAANKQVDVLSSDKGGTISHIVTKPLNVAADTVNIMTGNLLRGGMNLFTRNYNRKDVKETVKAEDVSSDDIYKAMMRSDKGQKKVKKKINELESYLTSPRTSSQATSDVSDDDYEL